MVWRYIILNCLSHKNKNNTHHLPIREREREGGREGGKERARERERGGESEFYYSIHSLLLCGHIAFESMLISNTVELACQLLWYVCPII